MPENELEITLKLNDTATPEATKRIKAVGDTAEVAGKKTTSGFREAGKAIHDIHKELFAFSVGMGLVITALNEWGKRNQQTKETMQELGMATSSVVSKVGQFIEQQTLLGQAFQWAGVAAREYNKNSGDSVTVLQQAKNSLQEFNQGLTDSKTLFLDGKMSAEEYYIAVYDGQLNQITMNQQAAQSIQQLAQLTQEVNNNELMNARLKTNEQVGLLNYYKQNFDTAHQGMAALTVTIGKSIQTNMSSAFTSMITGAKSAKEAFADLGRSMINVIVDFMAQKVVAWVLEKTLLAGTVAASSTAAMTIAAAWAPAAALVSAATFGASAVAGAAALTTTAGVATGIAAMSGRSISVQSTMSGGGNVLARASGGDDIVTRPTLFLAGEAGPERATFTPLGSGSSGGGEGIQVNVYGGNFNSRDMIRTLAEEIGFEIDRKLRGARSFA